MAQLAIKGHPTRGNEVIEILEMLGGINELLLIGNGKGIYLIDSRDNIIYYIPPEDIVDDFTIFTLEEFLEKYPYKTGDSVFVEGKECLITDVIWHNELNCIRYEVFHTTGSLTNGWYYVCNLQPYKEETMEGKLVCNEVMSLKIGQTLLRNRQIIFSTDSPDKTELVLGDNFEVQIKDNKTYIVRKQPQYPKTYEECCRVLEIQSDWHLTFELNNPAPCDLYVNKEFEYVCKLEAFRKLLICRDAYWKIAGEQMGLGKPFEPDLNDENETYYTISYDGVNIKCYNNTDVYSKLAFPTEEMRDAFYENFKDLIEQCKELL